MSDQSRSSSFKPLNIWLRVSLGATFEGNEPPGPFFSEVYNVLRLFHDDRVEGSEEEGLWRESLVLYRPIPIVN